MAGKQATSQQQEADWCLTPSLGRSRFDLEGEKLCDKEAEQQRRGSGRVEAQHFGLS